MKTFFVLALLVSTNLFAVEAPLPFVTETGTKTDTSTVTLPPPSAPAAVEAVPEKAPECRGITVKLTVHNEEGMKFAQDRAKQLRKNRFAKQYGDFVCLASMCTPCNPLVIDIAKEMEQKK